MQEFRVSPDNVIAVGAEITVEGKYKFTGGNEKFKGLTGNGTFKTRMTSPRDVEATWQGAYELVSAKGHGRWTAHKAVWALD